MKLNFPTILFLSHYGDEYYDNYCKAIYTNSEKNIRVILNKRSENIEAEVNTEQLKNTLFKQSYKVKRKIDMKTRQEIKEAITNYFWVE